MLLKIILSLLAVVLVLAGSVAAGHGDFLGTFVCLGIVAGILIFMGWYTRQEEQ